MNKIVAFFKHFKTVCTHKAAVARFCFMCGLYFQGIVHDLSKFSPTEYLESVLYYTGVKSPIDVCKEKNGYSKAWQHHKGRNKHHYEYWTDNYDKGTTAIKMPFKYALEMICDYLGAGYAYSKGNLSMKSEIDWWENKKKTAFMHEDTKAFVDEIFYDMYMNGIENVLCDRKKIADYKKRYNKKIYIKKDMAKHSHAIA